MLHTETAWNGPGNQVTSIPDTLNRSMLFLAEKKENLKPKIIGMLMNLLMCCTHYPHIVISTAFTNFGAHYVLPKGLQQE